MSSAVQKRMKQEYIAFGLAFALIKLSKAPNSTFCPSILDTLPSEWKTAGINNSLITTATKLQAELPKYMQAYSLFCALFYLPNDDIRHHRMVESLQHVIKLLSDHAHESEEFFSLLGKKFRRFLSPSSSASTSSSSASPILYSLFITNLLSILLVDIFSLSRYHEEGSSSYSTLPSTKESEAKEESFKEAFIQSFLTFQRDLIQLLLCTTIDITIKHFSNNSNSINNTNNHPHNNVHLQDEEKLNQICFLVGDGLFHLLQTCKRVDYENTQLHATTSILSSTTTPSSTSAAVSTAGRVPEGHKQGMITTYRYEMESWALQLLAQMTVMLPPQAAGLTTALQTVAEEIERSSFSCS